MESAFVNKKKPTELGHSCVHPFTFCRVHQANIYGGTGANTPLKTHPLAKIMTQEHILRLTGKISYHSLIRSKNNYNYTTDSTITI